MLDHAVPGDAVSTVNSTIGLVSNRVSFTSTASSTSGSLNNTTNTISTTSTVSSTQPQAVTNTTLSTDRPKGSGKVSERAKKKAWYSVLYPSYKSRSEDFKKLFKGVPDDERLVVGMLNKRFVLTVCALVCSRKNTALQFVYESISH